MKRKALSVEWNREGVIDDDNGEPRVEDEVTDEGRDESGLER